MLEIVFDAYKRTYRCAGYIASAGNKNGPAATTVWCTPVRFILLLGNKRDGRDFRPATATDDTKFKMRQHHSSASK